MTNSNGGMPLTETPHAVSALMRSRMLIVMCCVIGALLLLPVGLLTAGVLRTDDTVKAAAASVRDEPLFTTLYGTIFDRYLHPLTADDVRFHVIFEAKNWKAAKRGYMGTRCSLKTLQQLFAKDISFDAGRYQRFVDTHPNSNYHRIGDIDALRYIPLKTALRDAGCAGISFEKYYHRFYPMADGAQHIVGYRTADGKAATGMEALFAKQLVGEHGLQPVVRIAGAAQYALPVTRPPRAGEDVVTSIDGRLQLLTHRTLLDAVANFRATAAAAVVIDASSGEILSLDSVPTFNPNDRRRSYRNGADYNHAWMAAVEPGSTMKPFVIAVALDKHVIQPDTVIDTSPGRIRVGDAVVKDFRDYGKLDVGGILRHSSNVGAIKVMQQMYAVDGLSSMSALLWDVGFGMPTIGLAGEQAGTLNTVDRWGKYGGNAAIGYSNSATLLQLAQAYTVFANDGLFVPLRLTRQQPDTPSTRRRVLPASVAETVRHMLRDVVYEGTAGKADIPGISVAGKTGTVRKYDPGGGYQRGSYYSLFIGMLPAEAPRYIAAVLVDAPEGLRYHGGDVAAPIFAQLMTHALRINAGHDSAGHDVDE